MVLGARTAAWSGLSAGDYVQDGIYAMYDGIENNGYGSHESSPNAWKDLIGGWGDLTFVGSPIINSNGVNFNSAGSAELSGTHTRPDNVSFDMVFSASAGYLSVLWANTESRKDEKGRLMGYGDIVPFGNAKYIAEFYLNGASIKVSVSDYPSFKASETVHLTLVTNGNTWKSYNNGILCQSYSNIYRDSSACTFTSLWLGRYSNGAYQPITLNRLSVYAGAMSESAITRNHAIDKARFGLT